MENAELVSEKKVPMPQINDRQYRRLGWFVLLSFVSIFWIWGSLAPLSSAVSAPGKVIVASNNRIIQHLEGGIVKTIFVRDGDLVNYAQPLIELDATQATAQLKVAQGKYYENLAFESRLIAERDGKNTVNFSHELSEMKDSLAKDIIVEGQRREFNVRYKDINDQKMVLLQRIEQLRSQIQGLESIVNSKKGLSESYNEEIKEWEVLYQQQLIDKMRLRDIKREKMRTDGEVANAKADIARSLAQISEINAQIIAQKQAFNKEVATKLNEIQTELSDLRSRISALKDTLKRTLITAPVKGVITNLKMHTIGGVVPSGQPILEIVPQGEPLVIEGKVASNEINNIHVGLETEIRFPSFAHIKSLKAVKGKVIFVAPDAMLEEQTKAMYYLVKVKVTADGQAELNRHKLAIQAGMPSETMIVIGSRTFVDYMIKPLRNMFIKAFNEQ